MATITVNTFLDDGTARTAGEAWTMNNGSTLTIRTDTRWHIGAPAGMTGSLATITSSDANGGFYVNGLNVRWMPFDTGSGTVPAIGTTITQGGVSGYLLGVWASLTSAPTAVGAAMPATGFIKFREVAGGTFAAGALSGISANATGPDVTGWLEVVRDQGGSLGGWAQGRGMDFDGQWFYLDNTSGSAGQVLQVPTNGGGSGTVVFGVQIETAPGSDVFEWYPAIPSTHFTTTALTTDVRAKFVEQRPDGAVRIGSNGTSNVGFVPPSGCRTRVPNIFLRQCTTGARASNVLATTQSTWPGFDGSNKFNFDRVECQWNFRLSSWWGCEAVDSSFGPIPNISASFVPATFTRCAILNPLTSGNCMTFNGTVTHGFDLQSCVFTTVVNSALISLSGVQGFTANNCRFSFVNTSKSGAPAAITNGVSSPSADITITNARLATCFFDLAAVVRTTITATDYIERLEGNTTSSSLMANLFNIGSNCTNILIDGLTFGLNGTLANCHPFGQLVNIGAGEGSIRVRNFGTFASPLPVGASSTTWPQRIVSLSGSRSQRIKAQRLFLENCRDTSVVNWGSASNAVIEQVGTPGIPKTWSAPTILDSYIKGMHGANWGATSTLPLGTVFYDQFPTLTSGLIVFSPVKPLSLYEPYTTYSFSSLGGFSASNTHFYVGDYYISETPYFIKGHTGFQNVAPAVTGNNINITDDFSYQIDTGSGWSAWKVLSQANLFAEVVDPVVGFKLKIRFLYPVSGGTAVKRLQSLRLATTSTAAAQGANLYDLDTSTLSFTGLVPGSEVRCYTGTDPATAVEIGGTESSGSTFSFSHSAGGQVGFIRIFAMGYQPLTYDPYTFSATDTSLLVQQVVDRNYVNP